MTYSKPSLETAQIELKTSENQESEILKDDSMKEYYELKTTWLIGILVFATVCFGLVWIFYDLNIALNYLLGATFSLVYLNMLSKEVERVGSSKRKIGGTRLALFIGLMVVATRWQHLQVIPIFLGFLTYKITLIFYVLPLSLFKGQNKSQS